MKYERPSTGVFESGGLYWKLLENASRTFSIARYLNHQYYHETLALGPRLSLE